MTSPDQGEIRGADEIVIERRLNTIYNIREEILDIRKRFRFGRIDASPAQDGDGPDIYRITCGYRTLVDNYAMELEPLMRKCEAGRELLHEENFGTTYVNPRYRHMGNHHEKTVMVRPERPNVQISNNTTPDTVGFELDGLECLWDLPDPLEAPMSVKQFDAATMGERTGTVPVCGQIHFTNLDEMFRKMNLFLKDVGFELDLELEQKYEL